MNNLTVFDKGWRSRAQADAPQSSWANDVLATQDAEGALYLDSLRLWFGRFPLKVKDKRSLKTRLESFDNRDHLGGVNELSWWEFMRKAQLSAEPIPTATSPRPDFKVIAPTEFFIEASTLNVSDTEMKELERGEGIPLDHAETIRRILLKVTNEKERQLSYAASLKRPCGLVLFDYTTWSGFGTQLVRVLANALLGKSLKFLHLPPELSALVYVERKTIDGRIAISRSRSAVYYNPLATYPLPVGTFTVIGQFWGQMMELEPQSQDNWIWL